ncbi:hypothetical protein A2U01_0061105, partial [Trifolium medium]|nr:hypothetical protein [Trifolium medium]
MKITSECVLEANQEGVSESDAVPDATTTEGGQTDYVDNNDDSHQKNASESVVVKDARASDDHAVLKDAVILNSTVNLRENMSVNTVVNPQDDEGMKTVT